MLIIVILNLVLRSIFSLYGYIATEEGTLLINQRLAYQGKLPFIDYDAWSSLLHDYFLGWQQLIFPASILTQRLIGVAISLLVFWACLKVARKFHPAAPFYTAVFLTFGSFRYLYISTVPYSEQFMTLFLVLALFPRKSPKISLVFATLATLVRSQALPASLLLWWYFLKKSPKLFHVPLLTIFISLLPWIVKDPNSILWAFFWPLKANQVLIYQAGVEEITISQLINFSLQAIRDYGLITTIALAGIFTKSFAKQQKFVWLLLAIILTQVGIGLIHQPPYASYIAPAFPLIAILAAATWAKHTNRFNNFLLGGILLFNAAIFPHAQFMKTSLAAITQTPHTHLATMAEYVANITKPSDKIISFYVPVAVAANRQVITDFARGPFSLTTMSDAPTHHLININSFRQLITQQTPAVIITTNKTSRVFADDKLLNQYYYLDKTFPEIRLLEDPKTTKLFIYVRKITKPPVPQ